MLGCFADVVTDDDLHAGHTGKLLVAGTDSDLLMAFIRPPGSCWRISIEIQPTDGHSRYRRASAMLSDSVGSAARQEFRTTKAGTIAAHVTAIQLGRDVIPPAIAAEQTAVTHVTKTSVLMLSEGMRRVYPPATGTAVPYCTVSGRP
jgi:hypothetical protein